MATFSVTTDIFTDKGTRMWFPFETDLAETVEQFWDVLNEYGSIRGYRLRTNRDKTVVFDRQPTIIGLTTIHLVTPIHLDLE